MGRKAGLSNGGIEQFAIYINQVNIVSNRSLMIEEESDEWLSQAQLRTFPDAHTEESGTPNDQNPGRSGKEGR
jgi:hypothetical protein